MKLIYDSDNKACLMTTTTLGDNDSIETYVDMNVGFDQCCSKGETDGDTQLQKACIKTETFYSYVSEFNTCLKEVKMLQDGITISNVASAVVLSECCNEIE